jgi:hypothetical protein
MAGQPTTEKKTMDNTTHNPPRAYRIVRIADPRSRGACAWFEVEAIAADGARHHVATCDDRQEARELVKAMRAAAE